MTDAACEISKKNAREWVARSDAASLQAWKPCGCDGCVYCDAVEAARAERLTVDRTAQTTTDGRSVDEVRAEQSADGNKMHASYIVLTAEERAKGFVRPVRQSYRHVGIPGPKSELRDLTDEEKVRFEKFAYVKFQPYPASKSPVTGCYWTQKDLDRIGRGCNGVTTMGRAIAETYARDPSFYGSTMCVNCGTHFPVGVDGEFVWEGTDERVGA